MRFNKTNLIAICFLGFGLTGLQAQEAIPAAGGNALGSGGSVSYSIGQVIYSTNTGVNGAVVQGVQQTFEISVVSGLEGEGINLNLTAYPNPTTDILILSVDKFEGSRLFYQLCDLNGKVFESNWIEADQTNIFMSSLKPAGYLLIVADEMKKVKTFKIVKN